MEIGNTVLFDGGTYIRNIRSSTDHTDGATIFDAGTKIAPFVQSKTSVAATFGPGLNVWIGCPDPKPEAMTESEKLELVRGYRFAAMARCIGRSFITTKNGYFGLAAKMTQADDCVGLIRGTQSAFILRPKFRRGSIYKLVGAAYVQGIMNGEYLVTAYPDEVEELWLQ